MAVGEEAGRHAFVELNVELQGLFQRLGEKQALQPIDQPREDQQLGVHIQLAGLDLGDVQNVVDQTEQIVARRVDRACELHLVVLQVAVRIVGQQFRQDQRAVQRRAQLVGHVGEEFRFIATGALQFISALFEHQLHLMQAMVLQVHFVALLRQRLGLFGELLVGLFQLGLLLFHVCLRLTQGVGLLFELLVGRPQLFLLHLQLLVELLGFSQHALQTLTVARGFDGRADVLADPLQQLTVFIKQGPQETDLKHGVDHAAVLDRKDQHRRCVSAAQRRADVQVTLRHIVEPHHAALQGHLAHQPLAKPQRATGLQTFPVPAELRDALQLAILGDVERANTHAQVAREEAKHVLTQGWQGLLANHRFTELGLACSIPGLLFQSGGMRLLLFERLRVAVRQTDQVTPPEIHQQAAENQAEQQKTANQRGGDRFGRIGTFGSDLSFVGDELIEQTTLFFLQFKPSMAADIVDDRLVLIPALDRFPGESDPLFMQAADALDSIQLDRVVSGVLAHLFEKAFVFR